MQNVRKYLIIMVAIAFGFAVIASCITLFSVKKVSADFSVFGESEAEKIQEDLDASLKGKSLVFLKKSDVYAVCDKYPRYEVTSVKKEYPNVLKIEIVKRVEKFKITVADKSYVLDGDGVVLNDSGETEFPNSVIPVDIGDLEIVRGKTGEKIATSDDALFYSVIKSAQAIGLTDIAKEIDMQFIPVGGGKYEGDALFHTYTGVDIEIQQVNDEGEEKIRKAFECYNTLSDYKKAMDSEKTSERIRAYRVLNPESADYGKIVAYCEQ